jgi:hypothetical protein
MVRIVPETVNESDEESEAKSEDTDEWESIQN